MIDTATLLSELLKRKAILEQQEAIILSAQKKMMDAVSLWRSDHDIDSTSTAAPKRTDIWVFTKTQMIKSPIAQLYVHQAVIQCITALSKNEKISIEEAAAKLGCSGEIALKLKKDMEDNEK